MNDYSSLGEVMDRNDITITLDANETYALGKLVFERMQVLAAMPQSAERDDEMLALGSFVTKMSPYVSARAASERSQWN